MRVRAGEGDVTRRENVSKRFEWSSGFGPRASASAVSETSSYYLSLPELRPRYQQRLCMEGRTVRKSSTIEYSEQLR